MQPLPFSLSPFLILSGGLAPAFQPWTWSLTAGLPPPASLLSSWVPPSQGVASHSLTENSYCRFKPLSIC